MDESKRPLILRSLARASTETAIAGIDDHDIITAKTMKDVIDASGGVGKRNVFKSGGVLGEFTATVSTNTFTIPDMTITKEADIVFNGLLLIEGKNYTLDKETGVVTLGFELKVDDTIDYEVHSTSFSYRDLVDTPDGPCDIVDNLTTVEKGKSLDASQGKVLNDTKADKTYVDTQDGELTKQITVLSALQGGFKWYKTLQEINSSFTVNTPVETVIGAMQDKSFLVTTVSGDNNIYPSKNGLLEIVCYEKAWRNKIEFEDRNRTGGASYKMNVADGKNYGWKKIGIADSSSLEDIGLSDADMSSTDFSSNLVKILNAMPTLGTFRGWIYNNTPNLRASINLEAVIKSDDYGFTVEKWASNTNVTNKVTIQPNTTTGLVKEQWGYYDNAWSGFKEVATTDKTEILCTPMAGITIVSQKGYILNGEFCMEMRVKKTDETPFPNTEVVVATLPVTPMVVYPCGVIARSGTSSWNYFANAYIGTNKEIRVCCNTGIGSTPTEFYLMSKGGIAQ